MQYHVLYGGTSQDATNPVLEFQDGKAQSVSANRPQRVFGCFLKFVMFETNCLSARLRNNSFKRKEWQRED